MREAKLDKLSKTIIDTLKVVNSEIKTKKFDYYDFIFTSFLKRYVYILSSINELIPKYKENKNFIIALSPLLRMGISDFISECYILSSVEPDKDFSNFKKEYEKRVEHILFAPILKEVTQVEKKRKTSIISDTEYREHLRSIYNFSKIAFLKFDNDTADYELKLKNEISPAKMFRVFSDNKRFKQYHASYPLYDYYSKMEHFGGFSNMINALEYKNEKVNTDRLIHTIIFISKGIEFCIENIELSDKDSLLKRLENIAYNYLEGDLNKNR